MLTTRAMRGPGNPPRPAGPAGSPQQVCAGAGRVRAGVTAGRASAGQNIAGHLRVQAEFHRLASKLARKPARTFMQVHSLDYFVLEQTV